MLIKEIQIHNFRRIREFDLAISAPVVVVAGANEAGKTSVQEAIRLAITGQTSRRAHKKELGHLVHEGQDDAMISVTADWPTADGYATETSTVSLKASGRVNGLPNEKNV